LELFVGGDSIVNGPLSKEVSNQPS